MTRARTWTGVAVVWIAAFAIHYLAIVMLGPGTYAYQRAVNATIGAAGGATWTEQIYTILVLWLPLAMCGFSLVFAAVTEYERQRIAAVRRGR